LAKRTRVSGGGGSNSGKSKSKSKSSSSNSSNSAYKAFVKLVIVYKSFIKGLKLLIKGVASTFTAIVAVSIATTKETSYNYTHYLHTRPAYIIYIPGSVNLTSNLAKLSL
jgi:hypothetical protein